MRRLYAAVAALLTVVATSATSGVAASADDLGTIADLGQPVQQYLALGSGFGSSPNGEPQAYYLFQGNPTTNAEFVVVDLRSKSVVFDTRVSHGTAGGRTLAYSPVDGHVYFATQTDDGSFLYRYQPGSDSVEYLGPAPPQQRVWSLSVADNGTVWAGTYPGGLVFSYDPTTGDIHNYGQAVAGEQYASSVLQVGDQVYVGTESHGLLARLDPSTGTFTQIPLPSGAESTGVDELYLRRNLLFAETEAGTALVRDLTSNTWVDEITDFSGRGVSPVDPTTGNTVYFRVSSGHIVRYNLDTLTSETTPFAPNAFPERFAWVDLNDPDFPGLSLALTYYQHGRTYAYNIQTGKGYYYETPAMGAGDDLTALGTGPDGKVYAGAYLSPPGMGRWNAGTKSWDLLASSGQVEGYGTFQNSLLYGRYPQGALHRYDVSKPWNYGTNPPTPVTIGNEQNRPQSFVTIGDTVAVSSVPEAGRLGGAITLWDPNSNDVQVFRNVVPDQTPVSLTHRDGLVYGGTSINGGYGVDPVTPEGKLFIWDPATHQTVFTADPVPGAATVSGLVFDKQGMLWGVADSTVFEFDPQTRTVVRTKQLFADTDAARYGEGHTTLFENGALFGVTDNKLFRLNTHSWNVTVLDTHATSDLTSDPDGNLYYIADTTHVRRYTPPID